MRYLSSLADTFVWKDLTRLNRREAFIENTITLPWLLGSWIAAHVGWYALAVPCSVMFFLTGLRQAHNGHHMSLGLGRAATWWTLFGLSALMMTSMHAVQFNHLRHHKYCLGPKDHEGNSAQKSWLGAILYGPKHIALMHMMAWLEGGRRYRRDVALELLGIGAMVAAACYLQPAFLIYHVFVMALGEMLTALFAVWTVHHDCDEETIARTLRSRWKNALTYNMFYHLEHHLFPAVPTIKLPELARRLDLHAPALPKPLVF